MVFTRFNCNIVTIGFGVDKLQNGVLFRILIMVANNINPYVELFKPFIPALQQRVKSHSKIYNSFDYQEAPQLEKNHHIPTFLESLCNSACTYVKNNIYIEEVNFRAGFEEAFRRFFAGLFVTLKHLIVTNNLNRTAFKNLIKPMAVLIHTISRLTGDDDTINFSFDNPLEFNAEGEKIRFQNPRKHAELRSKVKESSRMGRGCPMRNVNLDVDLNGTGRTPKVNIIKVLYYLCARQVEMALFGRKTETSA